MSRNFVVSLLAMLLVASLASWAADDGATLYKQSVQVATGLTGKANLP